MPARLLRSRGSVGSRHAAGTPFSSDQERALATFLDGLNDIPGVRQSTDGFATQHDLDLQRQQIAEGVAGLQDVRVRPADNRARLDAR